MYNYYDYGYSYGYDAAETLTGFAAFGIGMFLFWLICMGASVFTIICNWKIFAKAGKPGWASIIPIYNTIVMLEIAELPMWYIALYFVPVANIYALIKTYIELAHKFGKSTGFGVGMAFLTPVFAGILAFSKDANYIGSQNNTNQNYQQPMNQNFEQPNYNQQMMNNQSVQPAQPESIIPIVPVVEPVNPVQSNETIVNPVPTVEPQVQPTVNQNQTPAFCTNCGGAIIPGAKFCTKCGNRL